MEVDSFFGEFELFDDRRRTWTVIAKTQCVVYSIPKNTFINLFLDLKRRNVFLLALRNRLIHF